jgi:hypothetical protein
MAREVMMRERKYKPKSVTARPVISEFNQRIIIIVSIICCAAILTLYSGAHGRNDLRCGDEVRIETRDGSTFHGKLRLNYGHSLGVRSRPGLKTEIIPVDDVKTAYRIRRWTKEGAWIGMLGGTAAGLAIARANCQGGRLEEFGGNILKAAAIIVSGAAIGSGIGGFIGHKIVKTHEVQIDGLSICITPSRDKILLKISLGIGS